VFGCDVCQDVCPWNVKFARDVTEPALAPRAEIADVTLEEWAAMDEAEWKRRTQGTAIRRAKWEGFRRNVRAALSKRTGE
jgi:epoxyqueuosine reductase